MGILTKTSLGWNFHFEQRFSQIHIPAAFPGRVAIQHKTNYVVLTEQGEYIAECSGRLLYTASTEAELPKVGDWVVLSDAGENRGIIHQVLERRTKISRKAAGKAMEEQVIAANVDILFIVQGLDQNFNPARLERYLTAAPEGVRPVAVFNKADLDPDWPEKISRIKKRIPQLPAVAVSAANGDVSALDPFLERGKTIVFAGSSGVGKSSLINCLCGGERLATRAVREKDAKGRHTTTHRELLLLPGGAILIDTPGMRELQLWGEQTHFDHAFSDIEQLAERCRFRGCRHTSEVGCAIQAALESGKLDRAHWENYRKMQREEDYFETKADLRKSLEKKAWVKKVHREFKRSNRKKE